MQPCAGLPADRMRGLYLRGVSGHGGKSALCDGKPLWTGSVSGDMSMEQNQLTRDLYAAGYINCKETPEVSVPVPNQAALEEMILAILAKNQSYLKKQPEPKPSTAQQDAAISAASEPMPPADGAELEQWFGGQDGVASILNSLKMFEQD